MENTFLSVLLVVLGCVQLCDIFVSLALYKIYNRNTDYLCVTIIWLGAFFFFTSDVLLGEIGLAQIYLSFPLAGIGSIALGELTARLFGLNYSWKRKALILFACYLLSLLFYLFGFREFWVLGFVLGVGVAFPQFYVFWFGLKKVNQQKKNTAGEASEISNVDRFFLLIILIWGIHLLDYPFLRPLSDIRFSIFGFSFALFLTYSASILFPVMVNRKIYLQLTGLLSSQLDDAAIQLSYAQQEVLNKEKLAMVGTLTAGVAHEIKNPLNIIKNNNFLLKDYISKIENYKTQLESVDQNSAKNLSNDKEKLEQIYNYIDKNVNRADIIIKNMLMHSRKHIREFGLYNINDVIKEAAQFYFDSTSKLKKEDVQIEYELQVLELTHISLPDLSRAIVNILDNSFYALYLKAEKESKFKPMVKIKTYQDDSYIYVEVYDNGCGIPQEALLKINVPFYTTKPTGEGTGLGMYLVNEIADIHGGNVLVESVEGEYTQIKLGISKNLT